MNGSTPAVSLDQAHFPQRHDRRQFLLKAGGGIGGLALVGLMQQEARAAWPGATDPLAPRQPHFAPRAKRVIWLFMHGGPSHMDLFDPKPDLAKYAGQPLPGSFGEVMTRRKVAGNPLLGPIKPLDTGRLGNAQRKTLAMLQNVLDEKEGTRIRFDLKKYKTKK
ncbi:MAG: DUF1501 domain-containing protein [Verrucomicrobiota bacterium]|nr:DUF1501 domain-containing protein [Verrucomicrobiota bacterium]